MSTAINRLTGNLRAIRLSLLVSSAEAGKIARQAAVSGQSISAFLRERALAATPDRDEEEGEALRQTDLLIDKMSHDVETAINEVNATLTRLNWPTPA